MTAAALTPALLDLMEHEKVIEQGLATFLDVGHSLMAIRDGRKYRASGYGTFEAYCEQRWGMTDRHAQRMMNAAAIVDELETRPIGRVPAPKSESQVRPLAPLKDQPDLAAAAWEAAVEDADGDQPTAKQVAAAVKAITDPEPEIVPDDVDEPEPEHRRQSRAPSKPDLDGSGLSHPARYSDALLPVFSRWLPVDLYPEVLDPFAGTGRIHELPNSTTGVEIEPEWASLLPDNAIGDSNPVCGNALALPWEPQGFDAICTSPTYGNRLADSHNASDPERRRSYTHDLGRPLSDDNSGNLHWYPDSRGDNYRRFHIAAWKEAVRMLRPGGRFILNVKDHIRDGEVQHVSWWHHGILYGLGLVPEEQIRVQVPSLRAGANADARVGFEWVFVFYNENDSVWE